MVAAAASAVLPTIPARAIDREIDAGLQRAGGDHGHHADERFHEHRAVADHARVAFAQNHFRRGAGRDQRVEAADGAAGDGDEAEREDFAGKDRAIAIDEARRARAFRDVGRTKITPTASAAIAPSLMNALR